MKLSFANEFWIRAGERSGPVKNCESTVLAITRVRDESFLVLEVAGLRVRGVRPSGGNGSLARTGRA